VFFCKRLAPLVLVKNIGCLFNPDFQAFCPDFRNFSQISGLFPRLSTNEFFWVHLQPLHLRLLHHWLGIPSSLDFGASHEQDVTFNTKYYNEQNCRFVLKNVHENIFLQHGGGGFWYA